jgi:hypothetical protein
MEKETRVRYYPQPGRHRCGSAQGILDRGCRRCFAKCFGRGPGRGQPGQLPAVASVRPPLAPRELGHRGRRRTRCRAAYPPGGDGIEVLDVPAKLARVRTTLATFSTWNSTWNSSRPATPASRQCGAMTPCAGSRTPPTRRPSRSWRPRGRLAHDLGRPPPLALVTGRTYSNRDGRVVQPPSTPGARSRSRHSPCRSASPDQDSRAIVQA